eukprot:Nitzschia sp. Nitz4//scaffold394_size11837//8728//11116//NITZ4_009029-RA/size11837-processed-gene-0.19-mRNA-1//-1//CDS//3329550245//168//frame0
MRRIQVLLQFLLTALAPIIQKPPSVAEADADASADSNDSSELVSPSVQEDLPAATTNQTTDLASLQKPPSVAETDADASADSSNNNDDLALPSVEEPVNEDAYTDSDTNAFSIITHLRKKNRYDLRKIRLRVWSAADAKTTTEALGLTSTIGNTKQEVNMLFRLSHRSSPSIQRSGRFACRAFSQVIEEGTAIQVSFDGQESMFHAHWLWYNDPTYIHHSSGQRLRNISQYPGWKISQVEKVTGPPPATEGSVVFPSPPPPQGCLHSIGTVYCTENSTAADPQKAQTYLKVSWENDEDSNVSYYDWDWLRRCRYDVAAREKRTHNTRITPEIALGRTDKSPAIPEVGYAELFPQDDGVPDKAALLKVLDGIAAHGSVIIKESPLNTFASYHPDAPEGHDEVGSSVAKVGRALSGGALSHGALYGDLFHVVSLPNPLNIAYSTYPLAPHQDLCYFESKPGMQLLHCIRNNQECIRGGESTLVDAVAAAEQLRHLAPFHFQTLCECHGTFTKQRQSADMVYSRPHIVLGDSGQVVAVHWSPPFEAPPNVDPERMDEYLVAYSAFERMLDDGVGPSHCLQPELDEVLGKYAKDYTWERMLQPGDIMIFNNERMLHGRRGFELLDGDMGDDVYRHLMGCYTNIDDTINTYRTLLRDEPDCEQRPVRIFGNASSC